ncbi:MAG: folylpolyglutamate synthase/dihydrofolate synthase family protein [Pseudomonadota bacterium]
MTDLSLAAWLAKLEAAHPTDIELGLERVASVAEGLGLLAPDAPVITVAGTNGKGSTVAVMEAVLIADGCSPGVYTSPHLLRFNERVRIAGREVSDAELCAAFAAVEDARTAQGVSLSYFEVATLAALFVFRAQGADVLLLEVGLGGRLDAVNIIDADIAVITSIGLDHQEWLGNTIEQIALEKAGIMRAGRPVVLADPSLPGVLTERAKEVGARAVRPNAEPLPASVPDGLVESNVRAALTALALLPDTVRPDSVAKGLAGLRLSGRRERFDIAGKHYILDVAHNPDAVYKLLEYIDLTSCKKRTICVYASLADKDYEGIISLCATRFDAWFVAALPGLSRAADPARIAACLHDAGQGMISVSKNVRQALRRAQSLMEPGDRLVVFGSFHTVAEALPALQKDREKSEAQEKEQDKSAG